MQLGSCLLHDSMSFAPCNNSSRHNSDCLGGQNSMAYPCIRPHILPMGLVGDLQAGRAGSDSQSVSAKSINCTATVKSQVVQPLECLSLQVSKSRCASCNVTRAATSTAMKNAAKIHSQQLHFRTRARCIPAVCHLLQSASAIVRSCFGALNVEDCWKALDMKSVQ